MKQQYIFPLILFGFYEHIYADVQPITAGEPLYGIVSRIGTSMDQANSGVSTIEMQLQSLSGSNIESLSSGLDTLIDQVSAGFSITEDLIAHLSAADVIIQNMGSMIDSTVNQTQSLVEQLGSDIDQLSVLINTVSAQDALVHDTVTQIDSKVDNLTVAVNNLSVQDALIYNMTTQIDAKVDGLVIAVNNVSIKDSLIYDTVTEIDSKVDSIIASAGSPLTASIYDTVTRIDTNVNNIAIAVNNVSTKDSLIYDTVTEIDTKVDSLAIAVNNVSAKDALIYSTVTQIDAKVDDLSIAVNNVSTKDSLIYDTVTQIDTKVDILTTQVNNVSAQNVLLYNLESVVDSKVDEIRSFPDFVQTPTVFNSQAINAKTSRYFFTKRTMSGLNSTETQFFSLRNNSVSTVVRISAVGCGMDQDLGTGAGNSKSSWVPLYKNATLTGESFSAFNPESVLLINTAGTFAGGTQVYELQAGITGPGVPRAFEYLPKELYSVIIAPGETLTVAAGVAASVGDTVTVIIMWEEIINY